MVTSVDPGSTPRRDDVRERKKQAVRRALRTATVDLGLSRGLQQVSVQDITARAGVSPRTFFNYFASKEDAALIELFAVPDEVLAGLSAGGSGTRLWAELTDLFTTDIERAVADGLDLPRCLELQARDPVLASRQAGRFTRSEARTAAAIAARLRDGIGAPLLAGAISGSCITAVRVGMGAWAAAGSTGPVRGHVTAAFDLFEPAFGQIA